MVVCVTVCTAVEICVITLAGPLGTAEMAVPVLPAATEEAAVGSGVLGACETVAVSEPTGMTAGRLLNPGRPVKRPLPLPLPLPLVGED